jgi:uncharacterized protein
MKININKIPFEGIVLDEEITARALDLETDIVKLNGPIKIRAEVFKITNAVTVNLSLNGSLRLICSRCLNAFEISLNKNLRLNYPADKSVPVIDLDPDTRQEIILDYPMKPLCKPNCKGLCPKCGKNLNEGGCSCGST